MYVNILVMYSGARLFRLLYTIGVGQLPFWYTLAYTADLCFCFVRRCSSYLDGVGNAGENATEFFNLYSELMKLPRWKQYLASSGALVTIGNLVTKVTPPPPPPLKFIDLKLTRSLPRTLGLFSATPFREKILGTRLLERKRQLNFSY